MNAPMIVALVVSLTGSAALVYAVWRFDRRDQRQAVVEAERIVRAEARRLKVTA